MTFKPLRVADYLQHIAQAIERIGRYTAGMDETAFRADELVQDAVIRNLEVVGEACRNIERADPSFAASRPDLPIAGAYDMRNLLAHGYFKVDLGVVWRTVQHDLPPLLHSLRAPVPPARNGDTDAPR